MITTPARMNRRQQMLTLITKFNLYDDEENLALSDQLLSTRLYSIFLFITLLMLIFFTGFTIQTRIVSVSTPSMTEFEHLSLKYPLTLSCPCSQMTIPYKQFFTFSPQYHQICSSEFVTQQWIKSLFKISINDYHPLDFRIVGSAQFQVLALLCRTADQFVSDAIKQFNLSLLITKQTLFRTAFDVQVAALVDELKANTLVAFLYVDQILSAMTAASHIVSALGTNYYMKSVPNSGKYETFSNIYSNKRIFSSMPIDMQDECSCENTLDCTFPSGFYNLSESILLDADSSPIVFIPGMLTGCLPRNSLLQSTLECFFDRTCLDMITTFTGGLAVASPLNFTLGLSRFSPNMTVDTIFNEMMIESWHNTSNFADYFHWCAPTYCTYSYSQRLSFVYMITTLIGLIGGLNVALYIIIPLVVTFFIRQFQSKFCRQNHSDAIVLRDPPIKLSKTSAVFLVSLMFLFV